MSKLAALVMGVCVCVTVAGCHSESNSAGGSSAGTPSGKDSAANEAALRELGGGRTHVQTIKEMQEERRAKR